MSKPTDDGIPTTDAPDQQRSLKLRYHGRILDHLGIQMYQSPVAALAELISNSWDADAEGVEINLPNEICSDATIVVIDDGIGMTFSDCQERYLNVGYARRGDDPDEHSPEKHRPILGRKGIGKFAGFGIASVVRVETVSKKNGERTVFEMDLDVLRTQEYVEKTGGDVVVLEYEPPNASRKGEHGTTVTLRNLTLSRRINPERFRESMSRRFLLHKRAADFNVVVDGEEIPDEDNLARVQFKYPADYTDESRPDGLIDDDGWGMEKLSDGNVVRWRMFFYEDTIDDDELRGVSVFAREKLAQSPFFFQLSGGLGGQHAQQYLSGQVEADFLDLFSHDLISPERQRINWERDECQPLLTWGRERTKQLLRLWKERRADEKQRILNERISGFSERLQNLPPHELKTVKQALSKLASISTLKAEQFTDIGGAILTAWEAGRLRELISDVANADEMAESDILDILLEMNVVTALHTAEAVKAKLNVIAGLNERIKIRELENPLRDYIAENPWLVDPEWETFTKEKRVKHVIEKAAAEADLDKFEDWKKRIDLVMSSSQTLLVVEFIRPGKPVDYDHLSRFSLYITSIRSELKANSAFGFTRVVGYLVSDKLAKSATVTEFLQEMRDKEKYALDWKGLLSRAACRWREFLLVLLDRSPNDQRLSQLADDLDLRD